MHPDKCAKVPLGFSCLFHAFRAAVTVLAVTVLFIVAFAGLPLRARQRQPSIGRSFPRPTPDARRHRDPSLPPIRGPAQSWSARCGAPTRSPSPTGVIAHTHGPSLLASIQPAPRPSLDHPCISDLPQPGAARCLRCPSSRSHACCTQMRSRRSLLGASSAACSSTWPSRGRRRRRRRSQAWAAPHRDPSHPCHRTAPARRGLRGRREAAEEEVATPRGPSR